MGDRRRGTPHTGEPVDHGRGPYGIAVLAVVALGGAVGALARTGVEELNSGASDSFPTGTFVANITGAFGLGLLLAALGRVRSPWVVKPLVGTGFFGAYTTYSTFADEIVRRFDDGHAGIAVLYAVVTSIVGLALATVGYALGRRARPRQATA